MVLVSEVGDMLRWVKCVCVIWFYGVIVLDLELCGLLFIEIYWWCRGLVLGIVVVVVGIVVVIVIVFVDSSVGVKLVSVDKLVFV